LNKKDENHDYVYDHGDDGGIDYSELDENEDPEEVVNELRGTIGRGDCLYCGAKNGMKYEGFVCFICSECQKSVHEDIYYRWAAGYPVEFED
jgi:hypothetical protein